MTKQQGSSNYTVSEMACLLELVKNYLPASKKDWEHVAAVYNATIEPGWKPRDAVEPYEEVPQFVHGVQSI
jgi:hypothetical protein